jgi:hypothetical protein
MQRFGILGRKEIPLYGSFGEYGDMDRAAVLLLGIRCVELLYVRFAIRRPGLHPGLPTGRPIGAHSSR